MQPDSIRISNRISTCHVPFCAQESKSRSCRQKKCFESELDSARADLPRSLKHQHQHRYLEMRYHGRLNSFIVCFVAIVYLIAMVIPPTAALPPPTSLEISDSLEIKRVDTHEITPRSKLRQQLSNWLSGSRVRMVAEISKPHIKQWHIRKRYRGVHH
jgi:hypothetical protein